MINAHNRSLRDPARNETRSPYGRLKIKRTVFYTGYLLSNAESNLLISEVLNPLLSPALAESNDLKYMANCILITPRPATPHILDKVGGMGKKISWKVTGTACYENRVWAARLSPVPETEIYFTENPHPVVVLAVRKGARPVDASRIQKWNPVPSNQAITFETVVGEKVVLRVEEASAYEGDLSMNKSQKRRHQQERDEDILYPQSTRQGYDDNPPRSSHYHPRYEDRDSRPYHDDPPRRGSYRGRGRGNGRGRGYSTRGGRGRGRARDTGPPGYKSLDDHAGYEGRHEERRGPGGGGAGAPVMNY